MSDSEKKQLGKEEEPPGVRTDPEGCSVINKEHVQALCAMGIPEAMAERALLATGCQSLEAAACWYFDRLDAESLPEDLSQFATVGDVDSIKMVFVVNTELKMGKGKTAAQVAHACLALYRDLLQDQDRYGQQLLQWESLGEMKIVLSGSNAEHLQDLQRRATSLSLPSHLTQDAGRTQIPSGSCTVVSIFGLASKVNEVTGTLSLL